MPLRDPPDMGNSATAQTEVVFPTRRSEEAQKADLELVQTIQNMLDCDESITARALTRRMETIRHVSSLTRDAWRMERVGQAQQRQLNIRTLTERHPSASIADDSPGRAQRMPDIRMIRSFIEAAHAGSMGDAARALEVGEPSITEHVKQVEHWLGVKLLLRHGRGVTLTVAGSRFLARAESAIQLLMHAPDKTLAPTSVSNKVTLAFPSGVGPLLAPMVLTEFHMRQPEATLEVREGTAADVEEWFINGQVDIAMLEDPPSIAGVDMELILVQSLGLLVSARLPYQGDPHQLMLRDLSGQSLIFLDHRHFVTRRITRACQQYGVRLTHVLDTNSIPLAKALTRHGFGGAVLPYLVALEEISQGRLLFYPIRRPQLAMRYVLASRSQPYQAEIASLIRHHLTAMVSRSDRPEAAVLSVRPAKSKS
jgi:LysR family nitrogen assimilation transcriptional regulator